MDKIRCEICGAPLQKNNDIFVCTKCGIQYTKEDLKKIINESSNDKKIEDPKSFEESNNAEKSVKNIQSRNKKAWFSKIKLILNNKNVIYPVGIICLIIFIGLFSTYLINMLQSATRAIDYNREIRQNFFYEGDAYINRIYTIVLSIVLIINFILNILLISIWKISKRTKITRIVLPFFISTGLASSIGVLNFSGVNEFTVAFIIVLTIICLFFIYEFYKVRDNLESEIDTQSHSKKCFMTISTILVLLLTSICCIVFFVSSLQNKLRDTESNSIYSIRIAYYIVLSFIFISMLIITSMDFFHKKKTTGIMQLTFLYTCAFSALACKCFTFVYIDKNTSDIVYITDLNKYYDYNSNSILYNSLDYGFIPNFKFWFFIGFITLAIVNLILFLYKSSKQENKTKS